MIEVFALMLSSHALADYPLQGDFLAKGKNHKAPIPGVPFLHPLLAHSAIHAGFVGLLTGSLMLGIGEFLAHTVIDWSKCDGKISYNQDQAAHVFCKMVWVLLMYSGAS